MEGHNTWIANHPGSLLVIPVADIAQHNIANVCFFVQNGYCLYDDVNGRPIPGMERFRGLVDVDDPVPMTFCEQYSLTEATAELATSAYAGVLMLQAMGLGGWMFDGIDRFTMLGASGDPEVPGLGFRYDADPRWAVPNPTGLRGRLRGFLPAAPRGHGGGRGGVRASESSARAGCSIPTRPAPGRRAPRCAAPRRRYTEEFKALRRAARRSTSTTPSASSPAPCRRSSS